MKKLLIIAAIFSLSTISIFADEGNNVKSVKLDDEHPTRLVKFANCNIFVTKENIDNKGKATVNVKIENLDETYLLILFGHAYSEKELKRQKITFDKDFPGTKGQRRIDTYSGIRDVVFIESQYKQQLTDIQINKGEIGMCRIPLYIAKYKNKSKGKLLIIEKQIKELKIEVVVEEKDEENYIRLDSQYNALIEEIGKQKFCNNPSHKPSLEEQELPYKTKIDSIKSEIEKIKGKHNWYNTDKGFEKFLVLKQKLVSIDFSAQEEDCGKHTKRNSTSTNTNCKYCNLTPQEISHKLEDYYKKIFSSNNRKEAKKAVMSDVNLLYGCTKHSSKWKNSKFKSGIEKYYRGIMQF